MKVSYRGRVRKINVIPTSMSEFKRTVQQKFVNCAGLAPDYEDSSMMTKSRILDDSELQGDKSVLASQKLDANQAAEMEESKAGNSTTKRTKNTIDFKSSVCFYEDSEGDFNVLSEDEDLMDATTYVLQHNSKALKCSIVSKQFYEDLRDEQISSDHNQSVTWQSSTLNKFPPKAKKEKKAGKQKRKDNEEISTSMMTKIDQMVKARVDAEMAAKLEEQSRLQETVAST